MTPALIPWRVALRDTLLIGLALLALCGARTLQGTEHPASWSAAAGAALLLTLAGYLLHEWGHLAGARLARATVVLPTGLTGAFLFRWDTARNTRRQFYWMACGGFAASLLTVAGYVWWLDWAWRADRLALILLGLGVTATFIIEVPEFLRVVRGGPIPDGAAFVTPELRTRAASGPHAASSASARR